MELTLDEQHLISEYRRLTLSGRDELLAYATALVRRTTTEESNEIETPANQCRLKSPSPRPEAEKTPIFTE